MKNGALTQDNFPSTKLHFFELSRNCSACVRQ